MVRSEGGRICCVITSDNRCTALKWRYVPFPDSMHGSKSGAGRALGSFSLNPPAAKEGGVDRRSTARLNPNCLDSFSVRPVDHLAGSGKIAPFSLG